MPLKFRIFSLLIFTAISSFRALLQYSTVLVALKVGRKGLVGKEPGRLPNRIAGHPIGVSG